MAEKRLSRRGFMRRAGIVPGVLTALSLEEQILVARTTEKTVATPCAPSDMPMGKIGHVRISRLICGGNLIGGYAHSRDLVYVSSLFKHYFTEKKIIETLEICEQNGINTIVTSVEENAISALHVHWRNGGKIQWIAQLRPALDDLLGEAAKAVDNGATGAHLQGLNADRWIAQGKEGGLANAQKLFSFLKEKGLIAGCSAHKLSTHMACEEAGIDLDYYFKTIHSHKYWSAGLPTQKDNMWSEEPEKTIAFMKNVTKPWIGFKVLAAGALNPTVGFKYALQGGADFMCVGMFDFQVADDAKIVKGLFARGINRDRPWRGVPV